ncbi:MAG: hypothetical protein NZ739_07525 [Verrucomicrobiae bacterium]|nr:hypothetical protein [Verrucomicrobiae bacterium]MCX7721491.1 hypothetical protein [Verrucomicrobiae bacterium]MDW7979898.1 hypothetical protein [Verrucomicrobiales bacterium]
MEKLVHIAKRLYGSSVAWFWVFNALRLASGVLLLPLLVKLLPKPDFGMYYVFLSLAALVPILDFGFSVSIGRAVSYAMGGATELRPEGYVPAGPGAGPNYKLLWELLFAAQTLYRWLALGALAFLAVFGTYMVQIRSAETTMPTVTWIAWAVTMVGAAWELYAGWWNVYLRSMNKVTLSAQLGTLAYAVKLALACVLLLLGCGLLSVPLAGLVSSLLQRELSRRSCIRFLGQPPGPVDPASAKRLLRILWPNTWRLGLQFLSSYLGGHANMLVCQAAFGLAASAEYGLSLQLISMSSSMAMVWTMVKWPLVGQYRTKEDFIGLQRMLRPRLWLQFITYAVLVAGVIIVIPWALSQVGSNKTILPWPWMLLLALNALLEMNFSFWGTLISTENRLPFVFPTIITNICSLAIAVVLATKTQIGLPSLVLAPLLAGCAFNYWYWTIEGPKNIRTSFSEFMFGQRKKTSATGAGRKD